MVKVIIQARVGSTRLLDKVLMPIEGQTMLERVVNRVKLAKVDEVIVATPDDVIVNLCKDRGWGWFKGSEDDVLDRYYNAAKVYDADVVVRITADCPLIDYEIIDGVVERFLSLDVDYCSNLLPRSYPKGLDTEVFSFKTLENEWLTSPEREHVTLNIRNNPEGYNISNVENDIDYSYMRWCVDTQEDLDFIRKVYAHFKDLVFGWRDVLGYVKNLTT